MPQWPGSPKKTSQFNKIDQWKHSSTTKIYQDTCTLTQGRMAYSTSCSAVSREAWHLGQHHLSIKILCFGGDQKSTIFKGMLLLIPLHLPRATSFSVSLGHDMTSTPKILASPGSSWPLCCLWPSMELPQAWTTLETRSEKTSTVWGAGWTRWLLINRHFQHTYTAAPPPQPPVTVPATATEPAPPLSWNQHL